MALKVYSGLTPSGDFPLIEAKDVEMPDGTRLSEFEGGGTADSVDWNNITNKPFGEESYSSEYSFEDTPADSFDALGNTWWKVSSLTPSSAELFETTFTFTFDGVTTYAWTPTADELLFDDGLFAGVQSADHGAGFAVCRADGEHTVVVGDVTFELNVPSTGIYFGYATGTAVPATVRVGVAYSSTMMLHNKYLEILESSDAGGYKIKGEYLPENIGGTAAKPTAIDLTAYESDGVIVETYADGSTITYTMEFDADGNPTKITDSDGNVTVLTW